MRRAQPHHHGAAGEDQERRADEQLGRVRDRARPGLSRGAGTAPGAAVTHPFRHRREATSDGSAHASINMRYPLEAGKNYVFGAGFASNFPMTVSPGYCQGVVTIVRS